MKNKYWVITDTDEQHCYVDEGDIGAVESFIEILEVGEKITVEVVEMSPNKYNELPEYDG